MTFCIIQENKLKVILVAAMILSLQREFVKQSLLTSKSM